MVMQSTGKHLFSLQMHASTTHCHTTRRVPCRVEAGETSVMEGWKTPRVQTKGEITTRCRSKPFDGKETPSSSGHDRRRVDQGSDDLELSNNFFCAGVVPSSG